MKLVINKCYGGFSISKKAAEFMAKRGNEQAKAELLEAKKEEKWYGYGCVEGFEGGYERTNVDLVAAVEVLGAEANGEMASLRVVDVPDGVDYEIEDYDGIESVREKSRSWG